MTVQNLSEDILFVTLPSWREIGDELTAVNDIVVEQKNYDVIIDFSMVQVITSVNISNLIILHQLLEANGRRLILCNVCFLTKCIFRVTGLANFFNFAVDKSAALEICKNIAQVKVSQLNS